MSNLNVAFRKYRGKSPMSTTFVFCWGSWLPSLATENKELACMLSSEEVIEAGLSLRFKLPGTYNK